MAKKQDKDTQADAPVRIEPTIGRVVWYRPANDGHAAGPHPGEQALAAIVAHVNDDGTLNLGVFNVAGVPFSAMNVPLVQDGDELPDGAYAEWMPYQRAQAKKAEAEEKAST